MDNKQKVDFWWNKHGFYTLKLSVAKAKRAVPKIGQKIVSHYAIFEKIK